MRPMRHLLLALLAFALLAAGCSSGDDDAGEPPADDAGEGVEASDGGGEAGAAAQAWIDASAPLTPETKATLVYTSTEQSGNVSHVRFTQQFDGVPVEGSSYVVHVLADGSVQGATGTPTDATPAEGSSFTLSEAEATDLAGKSVSGTVVSTTAAQSWAQSGPSLTAVWTVEVLTENPVADWIVVLDATTGTVLRATQEEADRRPSAPGLVSATAPSGSMKTASLRQSPDRCALPAAPAACVFLVDPIYAAGGELPDPSLANDHLTGVPLQGLTDPASGALVGEFANLEPPGMGIEPVRETDQLWGAGRGDRGFEAQNAYYWIDYGQRTVQRLGFTDIRNESFPVVALDPETVDNAFFSPSQEMIFMGTGTNGGINEGEDASGVLHEYGHALLDDVNPDLLGDGDTGAYHEAFGDIFAYLSTLEYRTGDAECFFAWTDERCLRRMDTDLVYPTDLAYEVHDDGMIYTGAIYDIMAGLLNAEGIDIATCPGTEACNAVRDRVLATVLASNFYMTPSMTLPDIAAAYLLANDAQFGGADAELIQAAFAEHGLVEGSGAVVDPNGTTNGTSSAVAVSLEITHTYRGDLRVVVGVADPDGNDLCEPQVLFTPDAADGAPDLSGYVDLSDTPCAAFVPPTPDQQWYLFVEDTLPADEGTLIEFSVDVAGTPYPALGLPLPIADADPTGTTAVVDGTGQATTPGTGFDTVTDGAPFLSLAIDHSYHGDLSIRAGVADATGTILCAVTVLDPVPGDSNSGTLEGDIDMSDCAGFYPPTPDQQWFVSVIDTAALDEGTIQRFSLTGPDGAVYDFGDLPVTVPDDDVDGIALLLDGTTGSQGTAGGYGQTSDSALPAASINITHPYAGDLVVTGGVVDASGRTLCEVVFHTADPSDDSDNLTGDVSLLDCAEYFPPAPDRQWFLYVADTLSDDVGTLDSLVLTGPNGTIFTSAATPIEIPDADVDGVTLVLDGSEVGTGLDEPVASVVVSHPYVGDLDVYVGVADATDTVICEVQAAEADIENSDIDLALDIPMGDCAQYYPPAPDQQWYAQVVDNFDYDVGTVDAFLLFGPDGAVYDHPDVPAPLPDADPTGIFLVLDGSQAPIAVGGDDGGPTSDIVASVAISHTYSGDLDLYVGVVDANSNLLCETQILASDLGVSDDDVVGDFGVDDCAAYYPPSPDQQWYLLAIDNAAQDEGTIDYFAIFGPDGGGYESTQGPAAIPDADVNGATVLISG